jgi:hypothetical protein
MEPRGLIEELVSSIAPSATVVAIAEVGERYRVTVAGTSGVVAACEVPRETVAAAARWRDARARLAAVLKRCADDVEARVPDGRG